MASLLSPAHIHAAIVVMDYMTAVTGVGAGAVVRMSHSDL